MPSRTKRFWLGLDIGTGGSRALLVDHTGRVHHAVTEPHHEMQMPRPLWAEQHPDDWWRAAQIAIRSVLREANTDGSAIAGIGLTGQMHGLVMLDDKGAVIRPALIWCDQRSQKQVDAVNAQIGAEKVLRCTANPMLTGFTAPKLLWVRDHEPEKFAAIRHILLPKDYIRYKLTGKLATDVSDASGTSLFDVANRKWSDELVAALGLNPAILPRAYESSDITGWVTETASQATALAAATPVVAGAGDQAASAIGNGIVRPGTISCTIGTSGVVFAYLQKPAYDPAGRVHTFCHAIPGVWHVMGVTQGAGLSLQWFRNRLAANCQYDDLTAEATLSPPGADGLLWLPYLMGERTPHLDAEARAAWVGLTARHRRADMVRSVLEGVCYSQKDALEIIASLGAHPSVVRLSGGGARSPFWHQLFADIFDCRVATLATQEGSAYGAALLALVGTGEASSSLEICDIAIREVDSKDPESGSSGSYRKRYDAYRALYPALKSTFHTLSSLDA